MNLLAPRFSPLGLLTVLALLGVLVLTWQHPRGEDPKLNWRGSLQPGDLAVEGVRLTQFRADGSLDFRAQAEQAYHDPASRTTFLYQVRGLRPQGDGPLTLQATRGRVQDNSGVVSLYQNVKVQLAPDYRVEAAAARYDPATGLLTSQSTVRLFRGDDRMSGVGMRLSVRDRTAQLLSRVRAHYAP